jgi:hypothetical protein
MKIIEEELSREVGQGKETDEQYGDLIFKPHETSTMWKILSSLRTAD